MRIDWFTFGAQVFNFVLLVYLLKRFLYRPVLDAIARREGQIGDRLEEARRKEEEVAAAGEELRTRRAELEEKRTALLRAAEEEAEGRRQELAREVREEALAARRAWGESLRRQRAAFLGEFRRGMSRELFTAVERVLAELADAELEERVVRVFLHRLHDSSAGARRAFLEALVGVDGRIHVRSAFPLASERRAEIEAAVEEWGGRPVELHFEEDPALALGVELQAGDQKVAWSVGGYLDALEIATAGHLDAEAG